MTKTFHVQFFFIICLNFQHHLGLVLHSHVGGDLSHTVPRSQTRRFYGVQ